MPIGPENANVVEKKVCVSTRKLDTKNKQHFKTMTVILGRILNLPASQAEKVCVSIRKLGTKNIEYFKTMTVILGQILNLPASQAEEYACTSREKSLTGSPRHSSYHGSSTLCEDSRNTDE